MAILWGDPICAQSILLLAILYVYLVVGWLGADASVQIGMDLWSRVVVEANRGVWDDVHQIETDLVIRFCQFLPSEIYIFHA